MVVEFDSQRTSRHRSSVRNQNIVICPVYTNNILLPGLGHLRLLTRIFLNYFYRQTKDTYFLLRFKYGVRTNVYLGRVDCNKKFITLYLHMSILLPRNSQQLFGKLFDINNTLLNRSHSKQPSLLFVKTPVLKR